MKMKIWNITVGIILSSLLTWGVWITGRTYAVDKDNSVSRKEIEGVCGDVKQIKEDMKDVKKDLKDQGKSMQDNQNEMYRVLLQIQRDMKK